jgi:hypothetical protein
MEFNVEGLYGDCVTVGFKDKVIYERLRGVVE